MADSDNETMNVNRSSGQGTLQPDDSQPGDLQPGDANHQSQQQLHDVLSLALALTGGVVALAVQIQNAVLTLRALRQADAPPAAVNADRWAPLVNILHSHSTAFLLNNLHDSGLSTTVLSELPLALTHCAAAPVITDQGLLAGWLVVAGNDDMALDQAHLVRLEQLARIAAPALQPAALRDQLLLAEVEGHMPIDGKLLSAASYLGRIGAWWVDLASNELYWSKVVREIHDVDDSDILTPDQGISFYAREHQMIIRQAFQACAEDGIPFDLELELITAKQRRIWVRAIGQPIRDNSGKIVRVQGAFQDIDRFKRTQQSLSEMQDRLDRTLETISDGFTKLDREWRMTYVNRAMERMLRRPREALLNRTVWEAVPTAKGGAFEKAARKALDEQTRQTLEFIGDSTGIWMQASIYPGPEGVAVYLQDITERRQLQESIENSERRLRAVTTAVADVVWDWDIVNDVLTWNEGLETQFGYPLAEVDPDPLSSRQFYHPDERERVIASIHAAFGSGDDKWEQTYRFKRKDGSYAVVRDQGFVIRDAEGRAIRMVGAMQDETERLAYQTQLEEQAALLDLASDAIIVKGLDHTILYWNRGAEELYGWPTARAIGHDLSSTLARIYVEPDSYYQAMAATQTNGQWSGRLRHRTRDKREITVASRWTLMRDAEGKPKSVLAVHTDITQQLETEEQLRRAQRLEAVGQLTGGIAHDFNNLLTVIQGNAELLSEALHDNERLHRFAQMTFTAAQRGSDLTSRLLAFARRQALEPKNVDVNQLITEMNALIRRTLDQSIEIVLHCDPGLWHASVDPSQLETALLNLCFNARDAMPEGGQLMLETSNVWLDAAAARHDDLIPGQYVSITVTDTGTGIPQTLLDRVFEPFYTTKEPGKGSGLGLSMVYGFIKQSAGHIRIQSQLEQGTRIQIYLPRARNGAPAETEAHSEQHPVTGNEYILLVEDDDLVRLHVTDQLQALGYRVTAVASGRAAMEVLQSEQPVDLLFTDIVMPGGMDGRQLADAARERMPRLRVLFTSGYSDDAVVQDGRLKPGVNLLGKPYSRMELAKKIRQVLDAAPGNLKN